MSNPSPLPDPEFASPPIIRWMRIIVWMMPSAMAPLPLILVGNLKMPAANVLVVFATFAVLAGLAYYDGRLLCQQRRIAPAHSEGAIMSSILVFIFAQLVLVPGFWLCVAMVVGFLTFL